MKGSDHILKKIGNPEPDHAELTTENVRRTTRSKVIQSMMDIRNKQISSEKPSRSQYNTESRNWVNEQKFEKSDLEDILKFIGRRGARSQYSLAPPRGYEVDLFHWNDTVRTELLL